MALMKSVATKSGGVLVECLPDEEKALRAEWVANEIAQAQAEAQEKRKREKLESGLDKLMLTLSDDEKALIKERLM